MTLYELQLHVATPTPRANQRNWHIWQVQYPVNTSIVEPKLFLCFTVASASSVDLYVTKPAKPAPTPKSRTKVQWHVDTIAIATILFELILGLDGYCMGTMSKQND